MADLAPRLRPSGDLQSNLPYARMIPGALVASQTAHVVNQHPVPPHSAAAHILKRTAPEQKDKRAFWLQVLLPQPRVADPFVLYQLVSTDLIILMAVCGMVTIVVEDWTLPWPAMSVFAVLVTLFTFSEGLYKDRGKKGAIREATALTRSVLYAMALVLAMAWRQVPPLAAGTTAVLSLAGLVSWRRFAAGQIRHWQSQSRNVLIVGWGPVGRAIARGLRDNPHRQVVVRGFVDDVAPLSSEVLGRIEDLEWLARSEFVDEVIVALPNQGALAREAAAMAYRNHLDLRAVPDLPGGAWPEAGVDHIGDVPVVTLHRESLPSAALFLKRVLDTVGALVGLALAAPVMAIAALLVRVDSPGPVFYTAERTGVKGRRFRCYKFRSMTQDAEQRKESLRGRNQREGPIFKIDDDPRITGVGRFLRRYSLDELPQLWNVLCGDMSLVGPRPHPVDEVSHYQLEHYRRLDVKPGLTGLWQVTARKSPSFELGMYLDLTYIENWTLALDVRILMSTLRVLFEPEGA